MKNPEAKNEIVIYQPNETVRLEVRVGADTVWLNLIGASLKDLSWKCFAFTQLDASEIVGLKARI